MGASSTAATNATPARGAKLQTLSDLARRRKIHNGGMVAFTLSKTPSGTYYVVADSIEEPLCPESAERRKDPCEFGFEGTLEDADVGVENADLGVEDADLGVEFFLGTAAGGEPSRDETGNTSWCW